MKLNVLPGEIEATTIVEPQGIARIFKEKSYNNAHKSQEEQVEERDAF